MPSRSANRLKGSNFMFPHKEHLGFNTGISACILLPFCSSISWSEILQHSEHYPSQGKQGGPSPGPAAQPQPASAATMRCLKVAGSSCSAVVASPPPTCPLRLLRRPRTVSGHFHSREPLPRGNTARKSIALALLGCDHCSLLGGFLLPCRLLRGGSTGILD